MLKWFCQREKIYEIIFDSRYQIGRGEAILDNVGVRNAVGRDVAMHGVGDSMDIVMAYNHAHLHNANI